MKQARETERDERQQAEEKYSTLYATHTELLKAHQRQTEIVQYNESLWAIVGEALRETMEARATKRPKITRMTTGEMPVVTPEAVKDDKAENESSEEKD